MTHYPANYHTHSFYCDGKSTLEEHVREAEKQGLLQLGFSSHSPVPFENSFAISEEKLPEYIQEIDLLQQKTDVKLLKSLECDFIPSMTVDFVDGETVETVSDFIFLGSKITADGDCSHEIKRRLTPWKESYDQPR